MTQRIGVIGAGGRMGREVCRAVSVEPDLDLVAAVDPHAVGATIEGVVVAETLDALTDAGCEVAVDFTVAAAARRSLPWLAEHGIHAVVGTSGLDDHDVAEIGRAFDGTGANVLVAANFAISAVLMMRFAELAAPLFETAEIVEYHHDAKIDAPSGTAMVTAERMAAASDRWAPDPTEREVAPGARGGLVPGGIHVHAVRMRGMVAHQEVILGALGQTLTIRQDSYDRTSFMPGVVLACRHVREHPGLTVGLEPLLGL